MRESSHRRTFRSANGRHSAQPDPHAGNLYHHTRHQVWIATILALGVVAWTHLVLAGHGPALTHLPYAGIDLLLAIPFAGAAIWTVARVARRLRPPGLDTTRGMAVHAGLIAIAFTVLSAPLAVMQSYGHLILGGGLGGGTAVGAHHGAAASGTLAGLAGHGATQALLVWPAAVAAAGLGLLAVRLVTDRRWRRRLRHRVRSLPRPVVAVSSAGALVAGIAVATFLPASPAAADHSTARGCDVAPQRTYDVRAINVEITVNRHGDRDPFGFMYVLEDNLQAVRDQEAALQVASNIPIEDIDSNPNAAQVSHGLGQDPIQPLVLRARLGECVIIKLRNDLTHAPRGGPNNNNIITQPGGVPAVSIDMQGVSYDSRSGHGGQQVGGVTGSTMTNVGQIREYKFYLDPLMGEGSKVFRSGGESTQLTAHGLFGVLIAEPEGARWFDPVTGQDKTDDSGWSNWEAMVQAPGQPTFREFAILYHEVGDEDFNLRRPLREGGNNLPMVDTAGANVVAPELGGGGTNAYRPGSRALNYRAESFFRRLQLDAGIIADEGGNATDARQRQKDNKSLSYSSYTYGDPATPIPRSYLGEPTKTRLAHVGFQQLHVHHLHGGATRWRMNPDADDTDMAGGLRKFPIQNAESVRLDSQTISPEESFNLEHECGAGGCQQAAGDFLYHCHIAHHYIAGMWGLWRVFDTAQPDLAPLPGASKPAEAVTSAQLLGTTLADGRTVVLDAEVTNPATQVGLESLVEGQLPPQGERLDSQDATVWDWLKSGPANQPVYVGEPDDVRVWANYRSDTPGQRHPILFNPVNGRPAYPLFEPHLGQRPPFSPNEHSGAPYLGDTATEQRPDGLCPDTAAVRSYDITAVSVPIQMTDREVDPDGMLFVLNEDKDALLGGQIAAEPLVIRSNVGDCVAITFGNETQHEDLAKTNMHTHFVQFDPLASDGVITGFSYEQSVFPAQRDGRELVSVDGPTTVTVTHVDRLREGIAIAVGLGTPEIEIRTIVAINGNQLTFDRPLSNSHGAGVPVTVEFTQHRWYSDVDSGTVFWHDHVDGIISWAHGLFAAHIIEPRGSNYRDPVTGQEARSGTIVDIINDTGSVGVGQSGSFREFVVFLHNGRPGSSVDNLNFGQECEEGSINLRAAPFGERTPPGDLITAPNGAPINVDPTTTDQRFEYNGARCRNAFDRSGQSGTNDGTVQATVTTVDPYVFSSVKYGEPLTPSFRAYVGDDVVFRTVGLNERGEALRLQGHRFRMERFAADGRLMDTAVTGISERFDYVLDGGAGGHGGMPGDYLYHSTRTFALESGAWGIFRVHDTLQGDLLPLPDQPAPPTGPGFPRLTPATGDTQANPGPNPPRARPGNIVGPRNACPSSAPTRSYSITAFDHTLPTAPFADEHGIVYALATDVSPIRSGQKAVEPLVLRVNQGDCVFINLRNRIDPDSRYGGTRAGFDLGMLLRNPQLSGGAAIGLNPDSTVGFNENTTYTFYADKETGTTIFQNLGSPASLRHGAYGLLIVEPRGSTWFDSVTGAQLDGNLTSAEAIIRPPVGEPFREFALTMQTTDQHFSRSIVPYIDVVAGNGINAPRGANRPNAPVPGAPPGTADDEGSHNKAYNHVSYRSEPLTARIGLTNAPGPNDNPNWWEDTFQVDAPYATAFSSLVHGDPATPIFRAFPGDRVVFRLGIGASDQLHTFTVSGHVYPLEPGMWDDASDHRSQLMTSRTVTAGQTIDAWLVGGAGGPQHYVGDYAYRDGRQPWVAAGMWGIFRVLTPGSGQIEPL
jgi:manganese oxidase